MFGNNIVFFPENIISKDKIFKQNYAIFFFNKFYRIFNDITVDIAKKYKNIKFNNTNFNNAPETYKSRCVWGYLHDYFHHQGPKPFDKNIKNKTRWFSGIIEEIKVDLQTYIACKRDDFIHSESVSEYIILERLLRYPNEVNRFRNFDSATGFFLIAYLRNKKLVDIDSNGIFLLDFSRLEECFLELIYCIEEIEKNENDVYLKKII